MELGIGVAVVDHSSLVVAVVVAAVQSLLTPAEQLVEGAGFAAAAAVPTVE